MLDELEVTLQGHFCSVFNLMTPNFHQHVDFAITRGLSRYKAGGSGFQRQAYEFERNLGRRLEGINVLLDSKEYLPSVRCKKLVRRGKARPILLYDIDDYIIQVAVKMALEPLLREILFSESSYGRRRKLTPEGGRDIEAERTVFSMVHRISRLRKRHPHILKADIRAFFPSVDRQKLMDVLESQVHGLSDNPILKGCIAPTILHNADVDDSLKAMCPTPERGIPQGAVLSPMFANCYLNGFDQSFGGNYFRYVDDFAICCDSRAEAEEAYEKCVSLLKNLKLQLDPLDSDKKCTIVGPGQALTILGLTSRPNHTIVPVVDAEQRLITRVKECFADPETGESREVGLSRVLKRVDSTIYAWHSYYAKCQLSKPLRQRIDAAILRIVKDNLKRLDIFKADFLGSPKMMTKLGISRLSDLDDGAISLSDIGYTIEEIAEWIEGEFDE